MSGDVRLERNITRREHRILLDVDEFATKFNLGHIRDLLKKAALIEHGIIDLVSTEGLSQEEIAILRGENGKHRRSICSPSQSPRFNSMWIIYLAAAVHGMAQFSALTYISREEWNSTHYTLGFVKLNAPYIGSALVGCWCTVPLNRAVGGHGAIFTSMLLILITSVAGSMELWPTADFTRHLCVGVATGVLECIIPIYCVEASPDHQRGRLTGARQAVFLFGQFLAATSMLFPLIIPVYLITSICAGAVCVGCWFIPESPRWLARRGQMLRAFESFCFFRSTRLQAARDLYLLHVRSGTTGQIQPERAPLLHFCTNPITSRAILAAMSLMVPRALSGYNMVMATQKLIFFGYGDYAIKLSVVLSYTLAYITAIYTVILAVDRVRRRKLLLWTIPPMACVMMLYPANLYLSDQLITYFVTSATFVVLYHIGQIPLTVYIAESFPIQYRDFGLALTISIYHGFIAATRLAMIYLGTWVYLKHVFALSNLIGFILAFFLMRETKNLALEEVPSAFEAPTRNVIRYRLFVEIPYILHHYVLRQNVEFLPFEDSKYGGGAIALDAE